MSEPPEVTRLSRSVSFPLLVAYGVGTMVGAGFYALLGSVAQHADRFTPLAFLLAAGVALLSALSFGELASRLPYSAGESRYVWEAFRKKWLSALVGWAVIATGVVSAATLARAFVGFLGDLVTVPTLLGITLFVLALSLVAVRGIALSVWVAGTITAIEVGGLVWVLLANVQYLKELPARLEEFVPPLTGDIWSGIFVGGFLSFYAFIGFEDIVNEAEEVRSPRQNVPRAILWSMGITSVFYVLIATIAVLAFQPHELASTRTPLALLVSRHGETAMLGMAAISLLAGVNGALVQLVMASRVAYGMSDQGMGPRILATVHPRYQTPILATLLVSGMILAFALWLPLESLASITSGIMLTNFLLVNASLVRIKLTESSKPAGITSYPLVVPIFGGISCLVLLALQVSTWFG